MKQPAKATKKVQSQANHTAQFGALPVTGFVRLAQLHGDPKHGVPGILPWSPATTWRRVREGRFPPPYKLSEHVTAWRAEDVRDWLAAQSKTTA